MSTSGSAAGELAPEELSLAVEAELALLEGPPGDLVKRVSVAPPGDSGCPTPWADLPDTSIPPSISPCSESEKMPTDGAEVHGTRPDGDDTIRAEEPVKPDDASLDLEPVSPQSGPRGVGRPRSNPLVSMLRGTDRGALDEWIATDGVDEGSLASASKDTRPGTYRFELSRFLCLFADRYGLEANIRDGECVITLPAGRMPEQSFPLELRMPLTEEAQLDACLSRRRNVIDAGPLVAHCLSHGRHTALRGSPLLSMTEAQSVLGNGPLELVHRAYAEYNFLVAIRYYRKEERVLSLIYSVEDESPAPGAQDLLCPQFWIRPTDEPGDVVASGGVLSRIHRQARGQVDRFVSERQSAIQDEIDAETREAIRILDDYYEEKARELEDEKRAVYFHLYYFEKEEAIDKQLAGIKREKEERARALKGFWDVRTLVRLLSVGYFEIPFFRRVDDKTGPWLDALSGRLLLEGGRLRPVAP